MKRPRTSVIFAEWPRRDQDLLQAANRIGGFLEPNGKAAHWKEKTRRGVVKRYSLWLGYMAVTDQLDPDLSPFERINEETLTGYVHWLEARGNASTTVSSCVRDLAEALRVMEPAADLGLLSELISVLRARQAPSRDKHSRIRHPDDLLQGIFGHLEGLPKNPAPNEKIRATWYRDSLAFAFLVCRPIRLKNLAALRLGHHLGQKEERWFCRLDASETKEKVSFEFTLPPRLNPYMAAYLDRYRPILLDGNVDDHLWISIRRTPMSGQAIYCSTCSLTERLFGVRINPHLLRDCAASALATEDPEHILAIARILGHKSIKTTTRHYNQSQMTAAGEILHEVLAGLRSVPEYDQHWSHE
jgi:integrase/recombinase XerD